MDLFHRAAVASLDVLPKPLMRLLAYRYIAGERLEEALTRLRELAAEGYGGILDLLGEDVTEEDAARRVAETYRGAADALAEAGLDAYVSVKPTHVGLACSEELAHELYSGLARHCAGLGLFLRVEMEDHTTTDATLRVFDRLRGEFRNVGIVLQSRLFRTPGDVEALTARPEPLDVRLVKGVYLEPPEIAHTEDEPIKDAFFELARTLLERGARVGFATHDDGLADRVLELCRELDVPRERYEMQVLMGVRERLWRTWRDRGERVRVYVPYGPDWRAYSTRRLRKNPNMLRHVVRDLVWRR